MKKKNIVGTNLYLGYEYEKMLYRMKTRIAYAKTNFSHHSN